MTVCFSFYLNDICPKQGRWTSSMVLTGFICTCSVLLYCIAVFHWLQSLKDDDNFFVSLLVLLKYPNSWLIKIRFCKNALSATLGKSCHVWKHVPLNAVIRDWSRAGMEALSCPEHAPPPPPGFKGHFISGVFLKCRFKRIYILSIYILPPPF